MRVNTVDRKKGIAGWIIVGLSAVVAVILYVREMREAVLGCIVPASYGFAFVAEARQEKQEAGTPRRIRPSQWVLIVACLAIGLAWGYYSNR